MRTRGKGVLYCLSIKQRSYLLNETESDRRTDRRRRGRRPWHLDSLLVKFDCGYILAIEALANAVSIGSYLHDGPFGPLKPIQNGKVVLALNTIEER